MKLSIKEITLCSLFASLTAIFAQIYIPLFFTPVDINMGPLIVLMCSLVIGKKCGIISQTVYIMMGVIGLPVFGHFSSGLSTLAGPTGGYIVGYVITAFVVGTINENSYLNSKFNKTFIYIFSMICGIISCYICGTIYFMYLTKTNLIQSLFLCVIPFLIGDLIKILIATFLSNKINKIYKL